MRLASMISSKYAFYVTCLIVVGLATLVQCQDPPEGSETLYGEFSKIASDISNVDWESFEALRTQLVKQVGLKIKILGYLTKSLSMIGNSVFGGIGSVGTSLLSYGSGLIGTQGAAA